VPPTSAGKRVKCPRCAATIPVATAEEEERAVSARPARQEEPRSRPAAARHQDEEEDEDDRPRPRKRKGRKSRAESNTGAIILLVVLGVIVVGAGALGPLLIMKWGNKDNDVANAPTTPAKINQMVLPPNPKATEFMQSWSPDEPRPGENLPSWTADPAQVANLGEVVRVGKYALRPPKTFIQKEFPAIVGSHHKWFHATAPQEDFLLLTVTIAATPRPTDPERDLDSYLQVWFPTFKWKDKKIERGTINKKLFVRLRWEADEPSQGALHGVTYLGYYGSDFIGLTAQEPRTRAKQELPLAEASLLTFAPAEKSATSPPASRR
jgi:hypothetical protein